MSGDIAQFAVQILPILLAITLHEVAHGWVANRLGDPTARVQGRLSLNPLQHIDPVGTVLFPLIQALTMGRVFFGWAKPVPVDPRNLRHPRRDMMWVALGGPAANLVQALLAGALAQGILAFAPHVGEAAGRIPNGLLEQALVPLYLMAVYAVGINGALMAFNLIPIPPLDGSRVAFALLPLPWARYYARLERYGLWLVMALIVLVPGAIGSVVRPVVLWLYSIVGLH